MTRFNLRSIEADSEGISSYIYFVELLSEFFQNGGRLAKSRDPVAGYKEFLELENPFYGSEITECVIIEIENAEVWEFVTEIGVQDFESGGGE